MAAIAEKQQATISLSQLRATGLTAEDVRHWVLCEWILRTGTRKVFRMPGAEQTPKQAMWIAILAGPKGTVVCRYQRLLTTTLARTVVDCAPLLDQDALNGLVDAAIGRGLCRYRQIRAAQARAGRVRGADRLTAALAPYGAGARPRSEKEAHVLRLFHSWGLPAPECQYTIRDERGRFVATVDFAWVPWRFGLEYDGDEFHSPRRWGHDDRRQGRIERLAWRLERADRVDLRPSSSRLRVLLTGILLQAPAVTPDAA